MTPSSREFRVRDAQDGDLAELVRLEEQAFAGDRLSARQYRRHLHSSSALVLVAAGARLGGSAVVFFRRGSGVARLYSLAVDPALRGRGLGSRLLHAVEEAGLVRGRDRLRLEVRVDNVAAIALYEAAGFRRFAVRKAYYEDGADAWRYEKRLVPARRPAGAGRGIMQPPPIEPRR